MGVNRVRENNLGRELNKLSILFWLLRSCCIYLSSVCGHVATKHVLKYTRVGQPNKHHTGCYSWNGTAAFLKPLLLDFKEPVNVWVCMWGHEGSLFSHLCRFQSGGGTASRHTGKLLGAAQRGRGGGLLRQLCEWIPCVCILMTDLDHTLMSYSCHINS